MNELGSLLRILRGKESLRDAGRRANVSHTYLSIIENGKDLRSGNEVKPTPETLKLLSVAYNCSYEDLMRKAGYLDNIAGERARQQQKEEEKDELIKEFTSLSKEDKDYVLGLIRRIKGKKG